MTGVFKAELHSLMHYPCRPSHSVKVSVLTYFHRVKQRFPLVIPVNALFLCVVCMQCIRIAKLLTGYYQYSAWQPDYFQMDYIHRGCHSLSLINAIVCLSLPKFIELHILPSSEYARSLIFVTTVPLCSLY